METSDSECFESADEDFQSDTETTVKKTEICTKEIKKIQQEINNLNLSDSKRKIDESDNKQENIKESVADKVEEKLSIVDNCNILVKNELVSQEQESNNVVTKTIKQEENNVELKNNLVDTQENRIKDVIIPKKPNNLEKNDENVIQETTTVKTTLKTDLNRGENIEKSKQNPKLGTKLGKKVVETKVSQTKPEITENTLEIAQNFPEIQKEEENLWKDDETWQTNPEEDLWNQDELDWNQKPKESQTWSNWGSWGTILSTATNSVSTITNQVSQGISTVLETGIGVPDPEELARLNKLDKEQLKEYGSELSEDKPQLFGLSSLMSGVTKFVESTGTKVISGGLDTLETIGKKTMEVLQEGDPGLKKKRAFLKIDQDKPVLSQLLREAKEKAEEENRLLEQKHFNKKAKNYETLFDDHQGLVHLEALEMLSKQCDIKLQNLLENTNETDLQETLDQIKELCELSTEEEDEELSLDEIKEKLNNALKEIHIPISYSKLLTTFEETETWLNCLKLEFCDERELHQQAIETLAQLTAIAVEQFHKGGELLLVKEQRNTADEADSLVQLTVTLTALIGIIATKFSDKLHAKGNSSRMNELITNIFYEAANSSSYIRDAFQLLIPVLQVGAV